MKQSAQCQVLDKTNVEHAPITAKQYEEVLNIQRQVIEMIAKRANHKEILDTLCRLAETLLPNAVASIMLKDPKTGLLSLKYAPSIPEENWDALQNLQPGPHSGSCGNAVYSNKPQYVLDTFTDRRWLHLREVAYSFNLCSCWSMPIKDADDNAIGSFALSSFEHRAPTDFHKRLLQTAANIVSIVMKNLENEKRIQILNDSMHRATEGIIFTDSDNRIIEVNKAFERIYGYTAEEVYGKNPNILKSGVQDKEFYREMWHEILTRGHWAGEIINKNKQGELIDQWMSISAVKDLNGQTNYFAIFTDMTELRRAQEKITYLAYHDQLTGLANKTKLEETLRKYDSQCAIIHVDINNFNYIDMAYGFEFGDKLLRQIAEVLSSEFGADQTFRINSDEFALLFLEEQPDLEAIILDIQRYFYDNPFIIENLVINVSLNFGASYPAPNLLENAALALKISKEYGKNRYHIFNPTKDQLTRADKNKFIEANALLYEALENNLIVPFFQGIWDNRAKKITKYEVLMRIKKDDTVISPAHFLEASRLSGLLPNMTKVIIEKSFAIMKNRSENFSINITEDDLNRDYLTDFLKSRLRKHGIEPQRVTLEILEGISAQGKKNHVTQLKALKEIGFQLAIDDFGAEYSNFERLLELDIDYIKIDARYIKNIASSKKSFEITRAISSFAKNLDITCIAEFVHSRDVQNVVESLGIEFSQGFYFSEPAPLD